MDVAQLRHQNLFLLQVLTAGSLGLQAAGGECSPLLVHVAGRQEVESRGGVVHVQQGLLGVGQRQAILGGVVGGEGLVELWGWEGAEGAEVRANLRHVEVLWLVHVAVGGHHHCILKLLLFKAEDGAVSIKNIASLDHRLAVDFLHKPPLNVQLTCACTHQTELNSVNSVQQGISTSPQTSS